MWGHLSNVPGGTAPAKLETCPTTVVTSKPSLSESCSHDISWLRPVENSRSRSSQYTGPGRYLLQVGRQLGIDVA
jgi:hypothetical protein